jgi:hypothetical protein
MTRDRSEERVLGPAHWLSPLHRSLLPCILADAFAAKEGALQVCVQGCFPSHSPRPSAVLFRLFFLVARRVAFDSLRASPTALSIWLLRAQLTLCALQIRHCFVVTGCILAPISECSAASLSRTGKIAAHTASSISFLTTFAQNYTLHDRQHLPFDS